MKPVEPDSSNPQPRSQPERPEASPLPSVRSPAGRGPAYTFAPGSRVLAGYVIKRGLGQGGFGEVYYAVSDAGKDVALKLVRRNLEVELRGVMQCLNVKHPNLIGLYDVRVDAEENHWIVMEYVAGERLTDIIERAPNGLPPQQAIAIIRGIGAGVAYLHDAGIVHRDLKPANIFVENGFVKIGDYGLSKFISSSRRSGQTESVGTVHYMAPEIANGRYGKQIDIYALGVLFYELLTGKLPFDGESVGEILMKHMTAEPDLAALAEPYRSAIGAALKKDPELRPKSVGAFLNSIEPALDLLEVVGPAAQGASGTNRISRADLGLRRASHEAGSPTAPRSTTARDFMRRTIAPAVVVAVLIGNFTKFGQHLQPVPWYFAVAMLAVLLMGGFSSFRFMRRKLRGRGSADVPVRTPSPISGETQAWQNGPIPPARRRGMLFAGIFGVCCVLAAGTFVTGVKTIRQGDVGANSYRNMTQEVNEARRQSLGQPSNAKSGSSADSTSSIIIEESGPAPTGGSVRAKAVIFVGLTAMIAIGTVLGITLAVGRKVHSVLTGPDKRVTDVVVPLDLGRPSLRALATDMTGSLLLLFAATLVVNRLLLLLLVDQLEVPTYLWTTATLFTAVSLAAVTIKTARYLDRESTSRRLLFFVVGAAAGAASCGYADFLDFTIPFAGEWSGFRGVKPSSWPECYVGGLPSYLAYMGYFGLSFLAIDWWSMTLPKRSGRWRAGDVFVAVFWAGVVHLVFPFPQPWGFLTMAGTALLLPFAFPLPPKRGVRIARREYA